MKTEIAERKRAAEQVKFQADLLAMSTMPLSAQMQETHDFL